MKATTKQWQVGIIMETTRSILRVVDNNPRLFPSSGKSLDDITHEGEGEFNQALVALRDPVLGDVASAVTKSRGFIEKVRRGGYRDAAQVYMQKFEDALRESPHFA